jgi:hypothetical protein
VFHSSHVHPEPYLILDFVLDMRGAKWCLRMTELVKHAPPETKILTITNNRTARKLSERRRDRPIISYCYYFCFRWRMFYHFSHILSIHVISIVVYNSSIYRRWKVYVVPAQEAAPPLPNKHPYTYTYN